MTAYAWPAAWEPASCSVRLVPNVREYPSPYTSAWSGVDLLGEYFAMTVKLPPFLRANSGAVEAFFNRLRGVHTVTAHHFARPVPLGTMRGSPTIAVAVVQGAEQISITADAGETLEAGDMYSAAGQLFQCAEDCVANGAGLLVVPNVNRARAAIVLGATVTWFKPTAEWRLPSTRGAGTPVLHVPIVSELGELELVQHWTA